MTHASDGGNEVGCASSDGSGLHDAGGVLGVAVDAVVDAGVDTVVGAVGVGSRDEGAGGEPVAGCAARAASRRTMLATSTDTMRLTVAAE
jgi:hypothetical protein